MTSRRAFVQTVMAGTGGVYSLTIAATSGVAPDATQPFTLTVNQPLATPPVAPTDLVATSPQLGSVTLTWTDNSINETGFEIAEDDSLDGLLAELGRQQ